MKTAEQKIKIFHLMKMKGVSGSENHLRTLLLRLDHQRFTFHIGILAEPSHFPSLQEYAQSLRQAGHIVTFFPMRNNFDLPLLFRLWQYLRVGRFQIVHTHLIHADLYGTLAAKLAGVPRIVSSKHNDDQFRRKRGFVWLHRLLSRWHDRIIAISDWVGTFLQEVEGLPAEKIVRIHYGLDPSILRVQDDPQYVHRQLSLPAHVTILGTIGQLAEQKGQTYLLQAIQRLVPEFPDLRLIVIGTGPLRAALERQAAEAGIAEHVVFTGYRTDAIRLLSGFDVFVFPSLWEGFGLVLLEAMAFAKPIIASRVSAIPESVCDGETGLLVTPKDVVQLTDAIKRLLADPALAQRMGAAGYRRLTQQFTVEGMVQQTAALYEQLVSNY